MNNPKIHNLLWRMYLGGTPIKCNCDGTISFEIGQNLNKKQLATLIGEYGIEILEFRPVDNKIRITIKIVANGLFDR